jgi:hypothetical protein
MVAPGLVIPVVRFGRAVLVPFVISLGEIGAVLPLGTCFPAKTGAVESILAVKPLPDVPAHYPGFPRRPSSALTAT